MKIKLLFKWIRSGLTSGVLLLHYWFWYFIRYSNHPEKYPIEKRYGMVRRACVPILKHFRADLRIEGLDNLQESLDSGKGTLVVMNHLSIFDMLTVIMACEKPVTFIAKKELRKTPLLGRATRSIDALLLDRDDPRQAITVFQKAAEVGKNKGIVCVYPEGTRNKHPLETPVADFHPGSFKVALRGECNIVCISCFGTFRYLAGPTAYRSSPVNIHIHKMIPYEEIKGLNTTQLAEKCHKIINDEVDLLKIKDKEYLEAGLHKKKGPKWWKKSPALEAMGKKK